jgi:hypothetical protein
VALDLRLTFPSNTHLPLRLKVMLSGLRLRGLRACRFVTSYPGTRLVDAWHEARQTMGFTAIALVQLGDETQDVSLKEAAGPLLAALRAAAG